MLDSDIDFCDKQIEIQREKLSALNSARHQANREHRADLKMLKRMAENQHNMIQGGGKNE